MLILGVKPMKSVFVIADKKTRLKPWLGYISLGTTLIS